MQQPVTEGGPGADTSMTMTGMDGSTGTDTSMNPDQVVPPNSNPINGIGTPTTVINGPYFEGPQWVTDSLYMANYAGGVGGVAGLSSLLIFKPAVAQSATNPTDVRAALTSGDYVLGTTLDQKNNQLITLEVSNGVAGGVLVKTPLTGALPRTGTAIALAKDGGGGLDFDSPNDLVVRKSDGTIYMTDPGYQADQNAIVTNHIWRVKPTTEDLFEIQVDGRPNGIALSPDDKTLYISYTAGQSAGPGMPATVGNIYKYTVNTDGSLGAGVKFADVAPASLNIDGLAVDSAGNIYVAEATGVDVFKPDATKWGHITTTKGINGLAFGGTDMKTLYMTSDSGLLSVVVKIAGLPQ